MARRMLIDATHAEETRVVVMDGTRLEDFDVETAARRQRKGNIYLAKVVRVEPALQAAFVEYGGNRHGFLAFGEIHPDYYQIPVADRQRLLATAGEEDAEEEPLDAEQAGEENGEGREAGAEAANSEAAASEVAEEEAIAEPIPEGSIGKTAEAQEQTSAFEGNGAAGVIENLPAETVPPEELGGDADLAEETRQRRPSARLLRQYKIQEVIHRRQIMLVQVAKEERGSKGAALTTYISLAGRYTVLMPNALRSGGISRKITSAADRKRLKELTAELDLLPGMGLIIRTAGANRPKAEIRRDCEYLLDLWEEIRERTLQSVAPALIYEEANLIKRAIRDDFTHDIEEVIVEGESGWQAAHEIAQRLMPEQADKVELWHDGAGSLFARNQVEAQLEAALQPTVPLPAGGYLVINQVEALVAIDVNSGRATRERHIEETALRTNLEAASEIARQIRLRDLAGLIVIDFIDMESHRHNAMVEQRLKEALRNDRARIQLGTISHFGLLEMSRQRLRLSLAEASLMPCPHCAGTGRIRSTDGTALYVLRQIEEEAVRRRAAEISVHVAPALALYVLNHKRERLMAIESQARLKVVFVPDDTLPLGQVRIERQRNAPPPAAAEVPGSPVAGLGEQPEVTASVREEAEAVQALAGEGKKRRRGGRRGRGGRREAIAAEAAAAVPAAGEGGPEGGAEVSPSAPQEPAEAFAEAAPPAPEPLPSEPLIEPFIAVAEETVKPAPAKEPRRRSRARYARRPRAVQAPSEPATELAEAPVLDQKPVLPALPEPRLTERPKIAAEAKAELPASSALPEPAAPLPIQPKVVDLPPPPAERKHGWWQR